MNRIPQAEVVSKPDMADFLVVGSILEVQSEDGPGVQPTTSRYRRVVAADIE